MPERIDREPVFATWHFVERGIGNPQQLQAGVCKSQPGVVGPEWNASIRRAPEHELAHRYRVDDVQNAQAIRARRPAACQAAVSRRRLRHPRRSPGVRVQRDSLRRAPAESRQRERSRFQTRVRRVPSGWRLPCRRAFSTRVMPRRSVSTTRTVCARVGPSARECTRCISSSALRAAAKAGAGPGPPAMAPNATAPTIQDGIRSAPSGATCVTVEIAAPLRRRRTISIPAGNAVRRATKAAAAPRRPTCRNSKIAERRTASRH